MATKLRDYHIQEEDFKDKEDALLLFFLRLLDPTWNYNIASDATDIMTKAKKILVTPDASKDEKTTLIIRLFLILQAQEPDNTYIPHEIDIVLEKIYDIKMKNKYLKYKAKYLKLSGKNAV